MNVLLISQCDKRALTETRRILDQFAERRGDRTWQTPITQDGLDTLRTLLRKTARKNTAVACHWIRGLDHSELLWVVGDRRRFNLDGAVPTNTTQRNVLRSRDENDWHTGEDILLLATLAALLHDIGKAIDQFQLRLRSADALGRNQYRHEWVSLRLFQAFVGQDDDATWLKRLAEPTPEDDNAWLARLQRDGIDAKCDRPLAHLPPLAKAVAWLVVTHHRLPVMPGGRWFGAKVEMPPFQTEHLQGVLNTIGANWNESVTQTERDAIEPYWRFSRGLPMVNDTWRKKAARVAKRLLALTARPDRGEWVSNPYVMHVARLALMLADHHYSSLTNPSDPRRLKVDAPGKLYANTRFDHHRRVLNQTLEEHLVGVASHAGEVCHALPRFEHHLPRLTNHKPLKRRSTDARFRWQDKAAELAAGMREASGLGGGFIVNMASTGCGKTLANARVMYALADPVLGMRCVFALGLRTLTLQTGKAFREAAALSDDDVAVRVGGAATRALFEFHEQQAEASGSASVEPLLPDDSTVRYEGATDGHPLLNKALEDPAVRRLLLAPVLVCTIDHMTPATECQRGGRQIAPMLRLMSSDLVIDELDDFDIADLPAVARLVHWAGLLGARVLLSSATLPPSLVQGMFEAYQAGRLQYARNRGATPGAVHPVACAWIDEFDQQRTDCGEGTTLAAAHQAFAAKRAQALTAAPVRRRGELQPLPLAGLDKPATRGQFAREVLDAAMRLHHRHHQVDPTTSHRVSFGLVRMANINPLYDVALALYELGAPAGMRIHLCAYHSQYPLLLRSGIEQLLDHVLDRRDPAAVFQHTDVRLRLSQYSEPDHLFIVLGSPVTEVGRDHDYDWAVVEPSSMRSLIQLAGRVWRHRPERRCDEPNIVVFDTNLKCWPPQKDTPAYCQPGFESRQHMLVRHRLSDLLQPAQWQTIDARPRIQPRPSSEWQPDRSLVDLEHHRLSNCMLAPMPSTAPRRRGAPPTGPALGAFTWWHLPPQDALLTAALPQEQPFRAEHEPQIDLCLLPDDDTSTGYALHALGQPERGQPAPTVRIDRSRHHAIPAAQVTGERITPWGETDYLAALSALAEGMNMDIDDCARRFSTITLPESANGWRFHPALGFDRVR